MRRLAVVALALAAWMTWSGVAGAMMIDRTSGGEGVIPRTGLKWWNVVREETAKGGVDGCVVWAVMMTESGGNVRARSGWAIGLMQVVSREAGRWFEDRPAAAELLQPEVNVRAGIMVLKQFGLGRDDLRLVLWRYSGGSRWSSWGRFEKVYWRRFQKFERMCREAGR